MQTDVRVFDDSPDDNQPIPRGDGGAGLVFWMLIALAIAGLAPCMILPAWRQYQSAEMVARAKVAEVAETRAAVDRQRKLLDAVHNDPAVIARLAQRDLQFSSPGQQTVPVAAAPMALSATEEARTLEPARPPVAVARILALLPHFDYDRLFCASPTRETILCLSLGLFVSAYVIFWPRAVRSYWRCESGPDSSIQASAPRH